MGFSWAVLCLLAVAALVHGNDDMASQEDTSGSSTSIGDSEEYSGVIVPSSSFDGLSMQELEMLCKACLGPKQDDEACESAIRGFEESAAVLDRYFLSDIANLDESIRHRLPNASWAHYRLGELYFRYMGNAKTAVMEFQRGVEIDTTLVRFNITTLGNAVAVPVLQEITGAFPRHAERCLDLVAALESLSTPEIHWSDMKAIYWFSILVTIIPFLLTTYTVTHYGDDFGRLSTAFKDKFIEKQFWREEDRRSLQRSNFFVAVAIPILMPQVFLFGGIFAFVSACEFALVFCYTGSASPAKIWKWASRLETLLFVILTPIALQMPAMATGDEMGRVLLLPMLRMIWGCMITVSIEELMLQTTITTSLALILATSSQTLEVHLQRSITVIFLSSLFFFICNILYYERRRNFMILLDLRNKNNVIDYLEQNGRVISFTVEVNASDSTIVAVSNSCQRLYGYNPSEMIGKRDESFVAKEDIPLILLDIDRARRKLLPQQKTADYHSMDGRGSTPAGLGETASQHRNFPVEGSAAGAGEAGTRTASDFPTLQERDDTGGHLEGFRAKGPSLAGGENDYSVGKVTRHLRYRRILANGEKAWVFGVGFYTCKADRLMLFYQEHVIQDQVEEHEKLLKEAEGDLEDEYDDYMADLNQKVQMAMARSHSMAEAYSTAWK